MFERNRIDNALQHSAVPAELTLDDGRVLKGNFQITASRSMYEVLNGPCSFLDFETHDGDRSLIAKAAVKSVKLVVVASKPSLNAQKLSPDAFDPHGILGLSRGAPWDDVRAAYVKLSKIYHPDLFAGVALPSEVRDYLAAMARRINAAYAALEEPHQAEKRATIEKAKPVYTSPQRF